VITVALPQVEQELLDRIAGEHARLLESERRVAKVRTFLASAATMLRTGRGAKAVEAYLDEANVKIGGTNGHERTR